MVKYLVEYKQPDAESVEEAEENWESFVSEYATPVNDVDVEEHKGTYHATGWVEVSDEEVFQRMSEANLELHTQHVLDGITTYRGHDEDGVMVGVWYVVQAEDVPEAISRASARVEDSPGASFKGYDDVQDVGSAGEYDVDVVAVISVERIIQGSGSEHLIDGAHPDIEGHIVDAQAE